MYESLAYKNALATKEAESAKGDDVDAFLNSLTGETAGLKSEEDVVQAPPAINLSLAGVLYARPVVVWIADLLEYTLTFCL